MKYAVAYYGKFHFISAGYFIAKQLHIASAILHYAAPPGRLTVSKNHVITRRAQPDVAIPCDFLEFFDKLHRPNRGGFFLHKNFADNCLFVAIRRI